jgi:hypothetical protein
MAAIKSRPAGCIILATTPHKMGIPRPDRGRPPPGIKGRPQELQDSIGFAARPSRFVLQTATHDAVRFYFARQADAVEFQHAWVAGNGAMKAEQLAWTKGKVGELAALAVGRRWRGGPHRKRWNGDSGLLESALPGRVAMAWIAATAAVLLPLAFASVPPLVDYPNHLARVAILTGDVGANYRPAWRLLPNLALDLLVTPLARTLGPIAAMRLFLGLTLAGMLAGGMVLHRAVWRRWSAWPLCAAPFLFNAALFWGLLNYLFGAAVYLFAFAAWLEADHRRPRLRAASFAAVGLVLVALHGFAFALLAVSVAALEAGRLWPARGWRSLGGAAARLMPLAPAAIAWVVATLAGEPQGNAYGGFAHKVYALFSPVLFGEVLTLYGVAASVAIVAAIAAGRLFGLVALAPPLAPVLLALCGAAVAAPHWVSGSGLGDLRIPVVLPFVVAGVTRWAGRRSGRAAFAALAATLLTWRVAEQAITWQTYQTRVDELRTALAAIPPGARIVVATSRRQPPEELRGPLPLLEGPSAATLEQLAALAVLDRDAFVPFLFTRWQPIAAVPAVADLALGAAAAVPAPFLVAGADREILRASASAPRLRAAAPYLVGWPSRFGFLLQLGDAPSLVDRLSFLQPISAGSFFALYAVSER